MNRRITIQTQAGGVPDPVTGSPSQAWRTVRTTWAAISAISSSHQSQGNQFVDQATHLVVIRYTTTVIAVGMRILYRGRVFDVLDSQNVNEGDVRLDLVCQEIDGASS